MSNPGSASSDTRLPPPQDHLPTTFLERGIAVPFTTPQLAGARVRPGARGGLELLVPNPSGGRGVYIVAWESMASLCRPTVHDARLSAMVAGVRGVTPGAIRAAARHAAAQGYAGRRAAAAAEAAMQADRQAGLLVNFGLLLQLVRAAEPAGECAVPPERDQPSALERRARRAIARLAPQLARTPEAIAAALEEISVLYSAIGLQADAPGMRIPALAANLVRMRRELADFIPGAAEGLAQQAELAANAIDLSLTWARAVMAEAHAAATNVPALLRRWIADPEGLSDLLARPDWLLDGWDRIAALWDCALPAEGRAAVLPEICLLLPIVPREAASWVSQHIDIGTDITRHRRKVVLFEDWRTGRSVVELVARNETVLAEAA